MKFIEALDEVSKFYIPGTAKYYDNHKPDPWSKAHDDLEEAILMDDKGIEDAACKFFVERLHVLTKRFSAEVVAVEELSAEDRYHLGSDDRFNQWASIKRKTCFKCEGSEGLVIVPVSPEAMQVVLMCKKCKN